MDGNGELKDWCSLLNPDSDDKILAVPNIKSAALSALSELLVIHLKR